MNWKKVVTYLLQSREKDPTLEYIETTPIKRSSKSELTNKWFKVAKQSNLSTASSRASVSIGVPNSSLNALSNKRKK